MTARLALLAVAALVPVVDLLVAQPPKPAGKKVALLIGVNTYTKRGLDDLKFAEPDVVALAATLKEAGFAVKTIRGAEGIDGTKTGRDVYFAALNDLLRGVGKADTVLLAFSGHGAQLTANGKESPYFCPADAVVTDANTLVSLNDVLAVLDKNGGGHNLVLLDACRNIVDPDRGARSGINGRRIDNLSEGTAVFFSCSGRQKARETDKMFPAADGKKGHGVFFHFVLEGLKGAKDATDAEGRVTWDRLVPFVKERVRKANADWFADVPADERQVPFAIGSLGDVPPLADAAKKKAAGSIEGEWRGVSGDLDGVNVPPEQVRRTRYRFRNDGLDTSSDDGRTWTTVAKGYKVDAGRTPAEIDVDFAFGKSLGIYNIDGDQLTLCVSNPGRGRPTEFKSSKEVMLLMKFERVPPK